MAEDDKRRIDPSYFASRVPLSSYWLFPQDLLDKWVALSEDASVTVMFSRKEIDTLLFGLLSVGGSVAWNCEALMRLANGDTEGAKLAIGEAELLVVEQQNKIRQFFAAIMAKSTKR